jgi:ribosomal protein L40E
MPHTVGIVDFLSNRGVVMSDTTDDLESELEDADAPPKSHVTAIVLGSLVVSAILVSSSPDVGIVALIFYFIGFTTLGMMIFTKEGRNATKEIIQEVQQGDNKVQVENTSTERKQICSECGWKNPKSNNYCHDCGSELNSE